MESGDLRGETQESSKILSLPSLVGSCLAGYLELTEKK